MGTWKSKNRHKYLLQYHSIFVCKYRKKLLVSKQISDDIKQLSYEICQRHKWVVHLLQCFIDIYKNIRGSNIEIRLDYPQELKSVEITTMLLKPIVENSFVHGMRGMDELFIVCLSAKGIRDEQGKLSEMILSVEDNGIGMDEEAVERLTKGKRTEPDEKDRKKVFRNIGVPNIIERLKMLYGDRAKLTVTSGENGTTIQIRLPADGEKKEII